ncbi:unnamed protein product [Rodentolepis nana]|uniref:Uncharacterized protein n=1 Tax=Rodentolepis nana TaxID=102285 RepID=A0A0R3TQH6_RODNA|nr:unnamed protein product [Rodentolepis nana]
MPLKSGKRFKAYLGGVKLFDTSLLSDAETSEDESTVLRPQSGGIRWNLARYAAVGTDFHDGVVVEARNGCIVSKATNAISKEHFKENSELTELTELSAGSSSDFDTTPMACREEENFIQKPKNQLLPVVKPDTELITPEQMTNLYAPWNTALLIANTIHMAAHPPKSNITLLERAKNRCKFDLFSGKLFNSLKNRQKYF